MIDGRIYHAGDTEPIDPPAHDVELALVPINGKVNNLDGDEAARLAHAMRAGLAVPMHFESSSSTPRRPSAFARECERLGQPYRVLRAGERLDLARPRA